MATLYEYYNTDDDTGHIISLVGWLAQTFTPSISHTITSVKLKVYRVGSPGTLTVSIRATTNDLPSGNDLCSGTSNVDDLTTDTAGEWREVTLGAGAALTASTKYAIVTRVLTHTAGNYVVWRADDSAPAYTDGSYCASADSGVNWSDDALTDFMFEEWGAVIPSPVVATLPVTDILTTTATGNGNITDLGAANPTAHGVCWNTTGTPTTADDSTDEGAASATGTFTTSMTGLVSGTKYYVRAYATNIYGTGYGSDVTFIAITGGGSSELAGVIAVVETRLHYVDAYGVERYMEGTVV